MLPFVPSPKIGSEDLSPNVKMQNHGPALSEASPGLTDAPPPQTSDAEGANKKRKFSPSTSAENLSKVRQEQQSIQHGGEFSVRGPLQNSHTCEGDGTPSTDAGDMVPEMQSSASLETVVETLTKELQDMRCMFQGLDRELTFMNGKLKAEGRNVKDLERKLKAKDREMRSSGRELEAKDRDIDPKDRQIIAMYKDMKTMESDLQAMGRELQAMGNELQAVYEMRYYQI